MGYLGPSLHSSGLSVLSLWPLPSSWLPERISLLINPSSTWVSQSVLWVHDSLFTPGPVWLAQYAVPKLCFPFLLLLVTFTGWKTRVGTLFLGIWQQKDEMMCALRGKTNCDASEPWTMNKAISSYWIYLLKALSKSLWRFLCLKCLSCFINWTEQEASVNWSYTVLFMLLCCYNVLWLFHKLVFEK